MSSALSLPQSSTGPRGAPARVSSALTFAGNGLSRDQVELLKRTVAKGVTDDELALFVHVANHAALDPFAKQIHAVKRWDGKQKREVMSIQTGIDGFRLIAARTKAHAGTDEAVFEEKDGKPIKASVTVWKVVAGLRVAFTASARWAEYVQTYKDRDTGEEKTTGLWAKMPYVMLAKCAEAQALRKAFPADLSGIYAEEEIGTMPEAPVPTVAPGEPETATPARVIEQGPDVAKLRSDLKKLAATGGMPEIRNVAQGLGLVLTGLTMDTLPSDVVEKLWTHSAPLGGQPIPPRPDPSMTPDDSPEGKALNASLPF